MNDQFQILVEYGDESRLAPIIALGVMYLSQAVEKYPYAFDGNIGLRELSENSHWGIGESARPHVQ